MILIKDNSKLINKRAITPGIVHCQQSALSKVGSSEFLLCTRTSERPEPGNEPYPKTLATNLK
jgi:hypothetical protein